MIALIAAMAQNRTIGRDGKLPWQLPADLQRFKQLTMGKTLLMGRKTYQSIGRLLPGRETIVLSRDPVFCAPGATVVGSLEEGIAAAQTELFICGGGEIYRQALPLVEKIYLTELLAEVAGDTFFPELPEGGEFKTLHSEEAYDAGQLCRYSIYQRCR